MTKTPPATAVSSTGSGPFSFAALSSSSSLEEQPATISMAAIPVNSFTAGVFLIIPIEFSLVVLQINELLLRSCVSDDEHC